MGVYSYLLGGIILAGMIVVVLRSFRTKAATHKAQAERRDLQDRIRHLPPPPVKAVKEPELKLPRRTGGNGSSKPFPLK
jgi:hypothetical protein